MQHNCSKNAPHLTEGIVSGDSFKCIRFHFNLPPQLAEMRRVRRRRRRRRVRRHRQRQGALHGQGSQEGDQALAGQVGPCKQEVSETSKRQGKEGPHLQ